MTKTPFLPPEIRTKIAEDCLSKYWKWERERVAMLSALSLTDKLFRELAFRERFKKVWHGMDVESLQRDSDKLSKREILSTVKQLEIRLQYQYSSREREDIGEGPIWSRKIADDADAQEGHEESWVNYDASLAEHSETAFCDTCGDDHISLEFWSQNISTCLRQILPNCVNLETLSICLGEPNRFCFGEQLMSIVTRLWWAHVYPELKTLRLGTVNFNMVSALWKDPSPPLEDPAIKEINMRSLRKFQMIDCVTSDIDKSGTHEHHDIWQISKWLGALKLEELELCTIDPEKHRWADVELSEDFLNVEHLGNIGGSLTKLTLRVVVISDCLSATISKFNNLSFLHVAYCDIFRMADRWERVLKKCVKLPLREIQFHHNGYSIRNEDLHDSTLCSPYPDDESAFDEFVDHFKSTGVLVEAVGLPGWKFCSCGHEQVEDGY